MDSFEIKKQLDDLVTEALAKNLIMPSFRLDIGSGSDFYAVAKFKLVANVDLIIEGFFDSSAENVLQQLKAYLAEIPSLEDRQKTEYLKRLAAAVEFGKAIGLSDDFINPLKFQMQKLSENVLEYKPVRVFDEFGDDIPF
jgi:hypothetical protein